MPIYRFESITHIRKLSGVCAGCGKRRSRTRRVEHTINPLNQRADGTPKSHDEVDADVRAELDALCAGPFRCATCSP